MLTSMQRNYMASYFLNLFFTVLSPIRIVVFAVMQSALETVVFRALADISGNSTIAHGSISERLNTINPLFFERIYKHCLEKYGADTKTLSLPIVRFDSTIVSLSTSLIKTGYNLKGGDAKNFRLLKFTVGYSNIPECICFYTDQTYNS